jgi:hypothetical protein
MKQFSVNIRCILFESVEHRCNFAKFYIVFKYYELQVSVYFVHFVDFWTKYRSKSKIMDKITPLVYFYIYLFAQTYK